jgi:hypothetical protein
MDVDNFMSTLDVFYSIDFIHSAYVLGVGEYVLYSRLRPNKRSSKIRMTIGKHVFSRHFDRKFDGYSRFWGLRYAI